MAKTLNIHVVNKVATYCQRGGDIVCGNSDYIIEFTFDAEWDEHLTKTARFITNGAYTDVVFEGTSVAVPVLKNATSVAVGVFSGNLKTTTPAIIACQKSILCEDGVPDDPPPDVYSQIIDLLNTGGGGSGGGSMPVPTINEEKMLDDEGYYAVYIYYSSITLNFGVFYFRPSIIGQTIHSGDSQLYIAEDGSMTYRYVSRSVDDSGRVVTQFTDCPYYYSIYTAKLS